MGKLYPHDDVDGDQEDITTNNAAELNTDSYDSALASTNMRDPSTMGITFTLKSDVKGYDVDLTYAMYEPYSYKDIIEADYDIEKYKEKIESTEDKKDKTVFWVRRGEHKTYSFKVGKDSSFEIEKDVYLSTYTHKVFDNGECVVTVVLANTLKQKPNDFVERNRRTVFQPEIIVSSKDKSGKKPKDDEINWYPFQLAFMLLEIKSFVEPESTDRKKWIYYGFLQVVEKQKHIWELLPL